MIEAIERKSKPQGNCTSYPNGRMETLSFFALTVLGFSFWFLMVVPLASHRETYSWLAGIETQTLAQQFSFGLSSTYRPLAQIVTWAGFVILDPHIFPTSILRQTVLQLFVYSMFVLGWWLIYSKAPLQRLLAVLACVSGGVFFSGYIHIFHIYGMFYVPVVLTLGALLYFHDSGNFDRQQLWFFIVALLLAFWHPFATGLFAGFYFGYYLDTFGQRNRWQHIQAIAILLLCSAVVAALVVVFPRAHMPLDTKLLGFLVSYQTNEVNRVASFAAFLMSTLVVFSMGLSPRVRGLALFVVVVLSVVFLWMGLPLLLLWVGAALIKLARLGCWRLFFLAFAAAMLPLGGGIGSPAYALFAVIMSVYATALGWSRAERALSFFEPRYVAGIIATAAIILLLVRAGVQVPVVTKVANPILTERERTYQLENVLSWLRNSDYCAYEIDFIDSASSPIFDVQSAITRRNRPPAWIKDVRLFWDTCLKCQAKRGTNSAPEIATITFGDSVVPNSRPVLELKGRYAGNATVWIKNSLD